MVRAIGLAIPSDRCARSLDFSLTYRFGQLAVLAVVFDAVAVLEARFPCRSASISVALLRLEDAV